MPKILRDSQVPMGAQLELVDKYSSLRNKGAVDEVLCLVTDDINLESTLNTAKGKSQFEAYLRKQQRSGDVEPATDVHGVPTVKGKTKLGFVPISFVAKFGIVDTDDGPKIEKIVVGRA
jgi:hypothetical protein